ncbi:MAG TPA: DUF445 domain-containing protein [Patescibacteria group bacterium]|nr:DUF445 domain-containing protein [Patescibacteria group bacterium]
MKAMTVAGKKNNPSCSNRRLANRFLLAGFLLFLLFVGLRMIWPESFVIRALLALVEAALVGGIADWFAVTALFRKPLGFPWHTALIPRNRAQLVEATARMVQNELVSATALQHRLASVRFMDLLVALMDRRSVQLQLGNLILRLAREGLSRLNPPEMARQLEAVLKRYAAELQLAPLVTEAGQWALDTHKDEKALDFLLAELSLQAARPQTRQYIYRYLEERKTAAGEGSLLNRLVIWLGEQTNALNVSEATSAIVSQLLATLEQLRDPECQSRQWIRERLRGILEELNYRADWHEALETWKIGMLERTSLEEPLIHLLEAVRNTVVPQLQPPDDLSAGHPPVSPLTLWALAQLERYWQSFKTNRELQDWVEAYVKEAVHKLVETEHAIVGEIVKDALNSLSDEDLNHFVEDKAGDDLQWIRINGSVVGAVVGLVLFLLLHVVYRTDAPGFLLRLLG